MPKKITDFDSKNSLDVLDLIPIIDVIDDTMNPKGSNKKITAQVFATGILAIGKVGVAAGTNNTAIGSLSFTSNTTGYDNTAFGERSLKSNTTGDYNTAVGTIAMLNNVGGNFNTAVGYSALRASTGASWNTAFGHTSLTANTSGNLNTAVGFDSLYANTTGSRNTAIGWRSLGVLTTATNCSAIGYDAQVTGSNQIQLGDSNVTVYAQSALQTRSDLRDKTEVRDTELGLNFISSLRPVDFKWDTREDYRPSAPDGVVKPLELEENAPAEDKVKYVKQLAAYNEYIAAKDQWLKDVKLKNITHDGSKTRNRFHHGLIAQEVKAVLDDANIDFGGFQDHTVNGGDDVLSIGYEELIAPMIKAIQELKAMVEELKSTRL